ncbi:MAG: prepilin-type N-terminal cleavage/methylation domain-containing protein [Magnetococcus sp. DMHC-6]
MYRLPHPKTISIPISGFSLIEFIMVIVILAALSSVIIEKMPGDALSLDAATRQVAQDIRYTQTLAMSGESNHSFIYFDNDTYQIKNQAGSIIAQNDLHEASFTANFGTITFNRRGSPGTTTVTLTISAGSGHKNVVVTRNTGATVIQ